MECPLAIEVMAAEIDLRAGYSIYLLDLRDLLPSRDSLSV